MDSWVSGLVKCMAQMLGVQSYNEWMGGLIRCYGRLRIAARRASLNGRLPRP